MSYSVRLGRVVKIADLRQPVVAAKADWLKASDWLGFTPTADNGASREKRRSAIARQSLGGYILEYITKTFGEPNTGFEVDQIYLSDRRDHSLVAGRLVAVHKLKPAAMPLRDIIGDADYERLQDMWASGKQRHRWSVAFPVVESYEIDGRPLASEVFDAEAIKRVFAHPSSTLRPLNERERGLISGLKLISRSVKHQFLSIEDEFKNAELSEIPNNIFSRISNDLSGAYEGIEDEEMGRRRRRAAWLAQSYVVGRSKLNELFCDDCGFDPVERIGNSGVRPRTLLDVHHKFPLCEGVRYTTIEDFELLCPTCHRLEHGLLRLGKSRHGTSDVLDDIDK